MGIGDAYPQRDFDFAAANWRNLRGLQLEIQVAADTVIFRPSGRSALGCAPTGSREGALIDVESMPRRMSVSAVIAFLRDRHGEAAACKMARLELAKARRARSRKRFDFWTLLDGSGDANATSALGLRTDAELEPGARSTRSTLTE